MNYSLCELVLIFYLYSILGWGVMTVIRSLQNKRAVNVGFLDGPVCPGLGIYFTLCIFLTGQYRIEVWWQIVLCAFLAITIFAVDRKHAAKTVGFALKDMLLPIFGFFGPYASAVMYLVVGLTGFCVTNMLQPFVLIVLELIPTVIVLILDVILTFIFVIDLVTSGWIMKKIHKDQNKIEREITEGLGEVRATMTKRLVHRLYHRLIHAYPEMAKTDESGQEILKNPDETRVFAKGTGLIKMFWIFLICALVGDLVETFYCGLVDGAWMSRSSVLYGPMSIVWGGGAALGTMLLEPFAKKNDRWVFLGEFLLGGAYEYLCSVFTEIVFGQVFWDYSDMPLNIGGRTNVLFMFFWGIAALVLIKCLYPFLSRQIEKIRPLPGLILTWIFLLVFSLDLLITGLALGRYSSRAVHPKAENQIMAYLDENYPDERIEQRWQNMIKS